MLDRTASRVRDLADKADDSRARTTSAAPASAEPQEDFLLEGTSGDLFDPGQDSQEGEYELFEDEIEHLIEPEPVPDKEVDSLLPPAEGEIDRLIRPAPPSAGDLRGAKLGAKPKKRKPPPSIVRVSELGEPLGPDKSSGNSKAKGTSNPKGGRGSAGNRSSGKSKAKNNRSR